MTSKTGSETRSLERLKFGAYGGVVFALMMGATGLSMIGQMVGHPSLGWSSMESGGFWGH